MSSLALLSSVVPVALALSAFAASLPTQVPAQGIPAPRDFLGFEVGADRTLADWKQITGYFARLTAASPAVHLDTLGPTTNGQPFIVATISTPENIARLSEIRASQALLADPRRLSDAAEARLAREQPSIVLISCNIHATEIASSQMAMELAWRLATNDTLQGYLKNTVVLLIPSMNPDGEQMITEWYRRGVGTKWEGGPIPWLYHPYVGHDNNRDWYMVTQKETRLATDLLYRRWFPQVVYDVHQMGNEGMRLFVPPMVDPVNPNLDPMIVRGINLIGAQMSFELEAAGKSGVGDGVLYDMWWHGGFRSTPTRHNMIALLTEAASVRIATPIVQKIEDLKGHSRGLPRYEQRVSFPNPWPGGTWRLRDIVEYELIAAEALVKLASRQREELVRGFAGIGRRQIALGRSTTPRAYRIPKAQRDPGAAAKLIEVLQIGGVEVHDGRDAFWVRLDQPYRAHAKDLLEVQRFPKIERWPGGPVERPYDVAGWTLSLQMGVAVEERDTLPNESLALLTTGPGATAPTCRVSERPESARRQAVLSSADTRSYAVVMRLLARGIPVSVATERFGRRANGDAWPAGSFIVERARLRRAEPSFPCVETAESPRSVRRLTRAPRVALYRPWTANMDEGWTRWILEQHDVRHVTVTDSVVKSGKLRDQFDVVIVPDMSLRDAREGMSSSVVPPEYAGGLGASGLSELKRFTEQGGTLVLLDRASEIGTAVLGVPVTRITARGRAEDGESARNANENAEQREPLYAPGSILRVLVEGSHAIAAGMSDTAAVYFTNSTTFDVPAGSPARVVMRYPDRGEDILLSGFLQGAENIAGKAAAVDVPLGKGRVIMFGFRVQYRGQSYGTFKLLFSALLDGVTPAQR